MKLDIHIDFDTGIRDVQFNARNAQINTVIHSHSPERREKSIIAMDINLSIDNARTGHQISILTLRTDRCGFTFIPQDLLVTGKMWLKEYGVRIHLAHHDQKRVPYVSLSKLQQVAISPETAFADCSSNAQDVHCPTVLGLGMDNRQFLIDTDMQSLHSVSSIRHRHHTFRIPIGRGKAVGTNLDRRLEQDCLPILLGQKLDEDILYSSTMFVTQVGTPLSDSAVMGTHFLVAEEGLGMPHTPQQASQRELARQEMNSQAQTPIMCCYQLKATNISSTLAYAFFYQPHIYQADGTEVSITRKEGVLLTADGALGTASFEGQPWPDNQIVQLLAPGESITAEYRMAHLPHAPTDAPKLNSATFDELCGDVRRYWQKILDNAAQIKVPEQRIASLVRAGLLHLQLVTYGKHDGTLAPAVGVYSPIGSESSPIIQFYDSMGLHDIARRSLQYFIDKQHEDGRFQNFGGYMLETGAALYTMGEHYRYTRDDVWVSAIKDQLMQACDWIIRHRHEDSPPGSPGAGLIKGKVADPEDHFRQYMLNSYQYLGLARVAEMLTQVDPTLSKTLQEEASAYRDDIRAAISESLVRSPMVPLGDGRWIPSCAPWVEATGPDAFALDGQLSYTHEAVYARDSLLGPIYAIFAEVLDPHEQMADFLMESHYEHMCFAGAAFSQPYYSRHPLCHLRRGEVHAFLRSYYNVMAALADRETYTFWEHLHGVSPHKTHEEGWFLMETRSMLYMESDFKLGSGGTLQLLPGIPRSYLRNEQSINIQNARSYYGAVNCEVNSRIDEGYIEAIVSCPEGTSRNLTSMVLRLPHPYKRRATSISLPDAQYDPATESVTLSWPGTNTAHIRLDF